MAPVVLQVLPYKWKPGEGIGDFSFHSLKDALLQSLHHSAEWKHYLETPNRFCQHWSILVCPFLDFNWCWQSSQWWWLGKKKNCFFFSSSVLCLAEPSGQEWCQPEECGPCHTNSPSPPHIHQRRALSSSPRFIFWLTGPLPRLDVAQWVFHHLRFFFFMAAPSVPSAEWLKIPSPPPRRSASRSGGPSSRRGVEKWRITMRKRAPWRPPWTAPPLPATPARSPVGTASV